MPAYVCNFKLCQVFFQCQRELVCSDIVITFEFLLNSFELCIDIETKINYMCIYIYIYWIKLYWFIPLETITALVEWTIFFEPPPRDRLTFPYTVSLSVSNISFSTIDGITRVIKADCLLQYVYKTKVFTEKCFHTVREKILRLSMHASMHYPTSQVQVTWNYLTCKESNMKTEAN